MIRKTIRERNILRKYLLMVAILILFIAGGFRAFTLYKTYKSYESELKAVLDTADRNKHDIIKAILSESHDIIDYKTEIDTQALHRTMIERMSMDEIYDNIVEMNLDNNFINILDEVFDIAHKSDDIILVVGTKDNVFYSKSTVELDRFKYIETSGEKYLPWNEYFKQVGDQKILKKAFTDLAINNEDTIILRIDNEYPNGTYCSVEDVIQDYHNNGAKNLDKYYILSLGLITDEGDIFGEKDNIYLEKNALVNKIYVFKAVSIASFFEDYKPLVDSLDKSMSAKIIEYRNTTEFTNALINIFLITSSIITLMVVVKSLDNENEELIKDDKPK